MRLPIIALVCGFASLTSLAAPAATRQASARSDATACPAVAVLASRGSGDKLDDQSDGLGAPGQAFVTQLKLLVPDVEPWANPYDAVGVVTWNLLKLGPELINAIGAGTQLSGIGLGAYYDSVVGGEQKLEAKLATLARDCSQLTAVVIVGYSQGAQVAADVVQRTLTSRERTMLAAVVLFGDPYFNGGDRTVDRGSFSGRRDGFLGRRPTFDLGGPLVLSYCHSHDPICQGIYIRLGPSRTLDPAALAPPLAQHLNYTHFNEPQEAAVEVAQLQRLLAPTTIRVRAGTNGGPPSTLLAGVRFGSGTRESDAVDLFGTPDSCRINAGPYNVIATWRALGVVSYTDSLGLANGFVNGCTTPSGTFVSELELTGDRWRTTAGLHPGDSLTKLRSLYPHAKLEPSAVASQLGADAVYDLDTAPCGYGIKSSCALVTATIKQGRVSALRVSVGGQGE